MLGIRSGGWGDVRHGKELLMLSNTTHRMRMAAGLVLLYLLVSIKTSLEIAAWYMACALIGYLNAVVFGPALVSVVRKTKVRAREKSLAARDGRARDGTPTEHSKSNGSGLTRLTATHVSQMVGVPDSLPDSSPALPDAGTRIALLDDALPCALASPGYAAARLTRATSVGLFYALNRAIQARSSNRQAG